MPRKFLFSLPLVAITRGKFYVVDANSLRKHKASSLPFVFLTSWQVLAIVSTDSSSQFFFHLMHFNNWIASISEDGNKELHGLFKRFFCELKRFSDNNRLYAKFVKSTVTGKKKA